MIDCFRPQIILLLISIILMIISPACNNEPNYDEIQGALRLINEAEKIWHEKDYDKNGEKDYWTYDVSCLRRVYDKEDREPVYLIFGGIAWGDARPATSGAFTNILHLEDWKVPEGWDPWYRGYSFQAMLYDADGNAYNQNLVGMVRATNSKEFGFVAYPVFYNSSGVNTYIINEKGIVYKTDCGSEEKKIVLQWPGKDPTYTIGPGEKEWQKAGM
jgi:hypothetical protein